MSELMTLQDGTLTAGAVETSPARSYIASLTTVTSRRSQASALTRLAAFVSNGTAGPDDVPWHELRQPHVAAIRSWLSENFAPATGNRYMAALRGVLKECWRAGRMTAEQYQRAIDVKPIHGTRPLAGRALSTGELVAMFDVCARDVTPYGARDVAILALLRLGLRRAECAALTLQDVTADGLRVTGKGRVTRTVPLENGAHAALSDWLAVRGAAAGPLFVRIRRRGAFGFELDASRHLTDQSIYNMVKTRAKQAHVSAVAVHDFRRTFIGDLLDAGADLATAQRLAGHASPTTTARYDRRPAETARRAVSLLHVPYQSRARKA